MKEAVKRGPDWAGLPVNALPRLGQERGGQRTGITALSPALKPLRRRRTIPTLIAEELPCHAGRADEFLDITPSPPPMPR